MKQPSFADDLLFFVKANSEQMGIIPACLQTFSDASAEKVLVPKTKLLVFRNVSHQVASHLGVISSGFSLTSDMGKYLGVPLLRGRKKINHYSFLLDKAYNET